MTEFDLNWEKFRGYERAVRITPGYDHRGGWQSTGWGVDHWHLIVRQPTVGAVSLELRTQMFQGNDMRKDNTPIAQPEQLLRHSSRRFAAQHIMEGHTLCICADNSFCWGTESRADATALWNGTLAHEVMHRFDPDAGIRVQLLAWPVWNALAISLAEHLQMVAEEAPKLSVKCLKCDGKGTVEP